MARVKLYGATIDVPWRVEAPVSRARADLRVELAGGASFEAGRHAVDASAYPPRTWFRWGRCPDGSIYLAWSGAFEFLIESGARRVLAHRSARGSLESFQTYTLTQVMGFVSVLRGQEPLHATVVQVDDRAAAFLGPPGAGKSTLAAEFVRAGHRVVTDDLLLLAGRAESRLALPGFPRLKLVPSAANRLLPARQGPRMNAGTRKQIIDLRDHYAREPVPLGAIYVLRRGRGRRRPVSLRHLGERTAYLELIANTFNPVLQDSERLARQFRFAIEIAGEEGLRSLTYPRSFSVLPQVRERVEQDLGV